MLIEIIQVQVEYARLSKKGLKHIYYRKRKVARLQCDSCNKVFERPAKQMDYRRLAKDYTHVCPDCDPKRFAQSKGVESRRFWNTTVDLDLGIGDL